MMAGVVGFGEVEYETGVAMDMCRGILMKRLLFL